MLRLFRQFSTPGGIPSHVSVPTPGSIHEGGELGYVLVHAFGAAFDNPDLIVACVVGDGEAETGPLEGSWKGVRFLNPARDGAVLPILHLNGVQDQRPDRVGPHERRGHARLAARPRLRRGVVAGDDPATMHERSPRRSTTAHTKIRDDPGDAVHDRRAPLACDRAAHAQGMDRPRRRRRRAGARAPSARIRCRSRTCATTPRTSRCSRNGCAATGPTSSSTRTARSSPSSPALAPQGDRRMGANPHANGGKVLRAARHARLRATTPSTCRSPATVRQSRRASSARCCATSTCATQTNFRLFCPDETNSNRLGAVFEVENRCLDGPDQPDDDHLSPDGRVMEVLSEHNCEGWLEGYLLTGRHGLFATYEAFAMVPASMAVQHAKWLGECRRPAWRAPVAVAERAADLDLLAQRPQRLQPPGPGVHRHDAVEAGRRWPACTCRPTPTACSRSPITASAATTTSTASSSTSSRSCSGSTWTRRASTARAGASMLGVGGHRRRRGRSGRRAGVRRRLADAGDDRGRVASAPVRARPAGARRQRRRPDGARSRRRRTRTGSTDEQFVDLFTADTDVVFAFHGYARRDAPDPARAPVTRRASTCAASASRARRRRRSTWSCSTR